MSDSAPYNHYDSLGVRSDLVDIPLANWEFEDVLIVGDVNAEHERTTKIFDRVRPTQAPSTYYLSCLTAKTLQTVYTPQTIKTAPMRWNLPGKGETVTRMRHGHPYTCGDRLLVEACPNADYIRSVHSHCNRYDCPICHPDTINRRVREGIVPKLQAYSMLRKAEGRPAYLYHIVLSEPPKVGAEHTWCKHAYDNNRRTMRRLLKDGLESLGGAFFFHPFRWPPEGHKVWKVGPHYHCLAYFDHPLTVDDLTGEVVDFHDRTGWVCKVTRAEDEAPDYLRMFPDAIGGVVEPSDIGAIATYLLSHVGIADHVRATKQKKDGTWTEYDTSLSNAVYYFGEVASVSETDTNAIVSVSPSDPDSFVYCPSCGKALYDYERGLHPHFNNPSFVPVPLMEARRLHTWSMLSKKETEAFLYDSVNNPRPEWRGLSTRVLIAYAFIHDPRFIVMDDTGVVIGPDDPFLDDLGGFGEKDGLTKYLASQPRRWKIEDGGRPGVSRDGRL